MLVESCPPGWMSFLGLLKEGHWLSLLDLLAQCLATHFFVTALHRGLVECSVCRGDSLSPVVRFACWCMDFLVGCSRLIPCSLDFSMDRLNSSSPCHRQQGGFVSTVVLLSPVSRF